MSKTNNATCPVMLLLLSSWLAAVELSVELINGAMSEGDPIPTGWNEVWTGDAAKPVTVHRDTAQVVSAPASLRFENLEGAPFGNLSRAIAIVPEVEFQIGASLRIPQGTERATFAMQGYDATGAQNWWQEVVSVTAGQPDTWVTNRVRATPPAGTARAVVILLISGKGSAWLDDVEISK